MACAGWILSHTLDGIVYMELLQFLMMMIVSLMTTFCIVSGS